MEDFFAVISPDKAVISIDAETLEHNISYFNGGCNSRIESSSINGGSFSLRAECAIFSGSSAGCSEISNLSITPDNFSYIDLCELQKYYRDELIIDKSKCQPKNDSEYNFRYILNRYIDKCNIEFGTGFFNNILQEMHRINCYGPYSAFFTNGAYAFVYNDKLSKLDLYVNKGKDIAVGDAIRIKSKGAIVISSRRIEGLDTASMKKGELAVYFRFKRIYSSVYSEINIELDKLPDVFKDVLNLIRKMDKNISLNELNELLIYDISQIEEAVAFLLSKKIIIQDPTEEINWNNPQAKFFTDPSKRDLINQFYGNNEE